MAVYCRLILRSDLFNYISKYSLINCNRMTTSVSHIKENIVYVKENIDIAIQQRKPEVFLPSKLTWHCFKS